jgi:F0F1-type ATP synthase membrane subunit b/b'
MKFKFLKKNWLKIVFLLVLAGLAVGVFWGVYKLTSIYNLSKMITKPAGTAKKKFFSELKRMEEVNNEHSSNLNKWLHVLMEEERVNEERIKKEIELLVEEKISTTEEQIRKSFSEHQEKLKAEFDKLAANMLSNIENKLVGSQVKQNDSSFNSLFSKLKDMGEKHNSQLVSLERKLANIKNVNMSGGDGHKTIGQDEVDSIIKQEVRKQLSGLHARRNPRLKRLKKVVALEKMRRLVKGLVDGEEYDDSLDF